jgi:hypothetical protein
MDTDVADFLLGGSTKSVDLLVRLGLTAFVRGSDFYRTDDIDAAHKIGMKEIRNQCTGNIPRGIGDDFMDYLKPAYATYAKRRRMREQIDMRMIATTMPRPRMKFLGTFVLSAAKKLGYSGPLSITTAYFSKDEVLVNEKELHFSKPIVPVMRDWWESVNTRGPRMYKNRLILAKVPMTMGRWAIFVLDKRRKRYSPNRLIVRRHIVEGRPKWI